MRSVFLDSVGLLALWNTADQWHDPSVEAMRRIQSSNCRLLTTTYVLLECGNAVSRTTVRSDVVSLLERLDRRGNLIRPTDADDRQAWSAYERGEGAMAGIVDHVSFAVMRRLGVREAFTNDRHFEAAGFLVPF
jgi:uncharacterized protein